MEADGQPVQPERGTPEGGGARTVQFAMHYFVLFTVMATVYPYFQLLLQARGFTKAEIGLLQGFMALAGMCGPMVLGYLADRSGQRRTFLALSLLASTLLLLPLNATKGFWAAALLTAGLGFTVRTPVPLTDALTAGELPDPVHQYGRVRVWGSIGFATALLGIRLLGLVDETSARSMRAAMLATTVVCLVSSLLLPEHGRAKHKDTPQAGGGSGGFDAVFWLFIAVAALHQFGMAAYYSFFTIYLHDRLGMESAAWVWGIGAAAEVPLLFYGGRIINRFGLTGMLTASLGSVTVRLGVIGLLPTLWAILPSQALHAMTFGLFHAASIEFLRRKVPAARRGLAMALYISLAGALPGLVGSSLGGIIVERLGYSVLYTTYAAVPLLGMALLATARGKLDVTA